MLIQIALLIAHKDALGLVLWIALNASMAQFQFPMKNVIVGKEIFIAQQQTNANVGNFMEKLQFYY